MFYAALVPFCFIFRNAQSDQGASQSTQGASRPRSSKSRHHRAGRNERPYPRNCQRADSCQPSERSAQDRARSGTGRGSFRSFRVLLVREIFRALIVRKEYRNICVSESGVLKRVDRVLDAVLVSIDPKSCCVFACHRVPAPF